MSNLELRVCNNPPSFSHLFNGKTMHITPHLHALALGVLSGVVLGSKSRSLGFSSLHFTFAFIGSRSSECHFGRFVFMARPCEPAERNEFLESGRLISTFNWKNSRHLISFDNKLRHKVRTNVRKWPASSVLRRLCSSRRPL